MNRSRFEHKKPHPSLHKQYLSICDYNEFAKAICSRFAKYRLNLRISDVIRRHCLPFENTHKAIIAPEIWEIVQKNREQHRRPTKMGKWGCSPGWPTAPTAERDCIIAGRPRGRMSRSATPAPATAQKNSVRPITSGLSCWSSLYSRICRGW